MGGVVLLLSIGFVGGFIAGRFPSDGWRTTAVHGGVGGAIGGLVFALTPWLSMNYVIPRPVQRILGNQLLHPHQLVEAYGKLLTVGLASFGGVLLAVEGTGTIAGSAAADSSAEPSYTAP